MFMKRWLLYFIRPTVIEVITLPFQILALSYVASTSWWFAVLMALVFHSVNKVIGIEIIWKQ